MKSKMTDQMTLLDNEQPTNKQTWYHVVEQTRDYVINVNLFCYAPLFLYHHRNMSQLVHLRVNYS